MHSIAWPRIRARLIRLILLGAPGAIAACSDAPPDGVTTTIHPNQPPLPGESACTVTQVTDIPVSSATHLAPCTPLDYPTNPPSGGDHWPVWAAFRTYDEPVPHEMLVHDLEHGAIALLYRCDGACPDVVAELSKIFSSQADPLCLMIPGGPPARMILAPDPDLPAPIAAAAWGATYTATCIDHASLQAFTNDHYGHGPEQLCTNGADVAAWPTCSD